MPGQPQVVLIGGAPGAGKTTLAKAVAAELGWQWIPGDALANAMRGVTTPTSHPALHVVGRGRHVEYFTNGPPEKLVSDAIALQAATWPGFERVMSFHARYGPSIVIESWTFAPANVAALGLENVFGAWIVIDLAVLEEREKNLVPPDYVETSSDPARRKANFFHRSTWCNQFVEREATRLGLPILRQDGSQSIRDHVAAIRRVVRASSTTSSE